jgi:hypothetical protein
MASQKKPEVGPIEFEDSLTTENLVAAAIWEQIELAGQKNGLSLQESGTQPLQIDPRFQQDFNRL